MGAPRRLVLQLLAAAAVLAVGANKSPGATGGRPGSQVVVLTGAAPAAATVGGAHCAPPLRSLPALLPAFHSHTHTHTRAAELNFDDQLANGKPWLITLSSHYVSRPRRPAAGCRSAQLTLPCVLHAAPCCHTRSAP